MGRVSGLNTRERNIAQSTRYEVRDSEPIPTFGVRIAGLTSEKRGAENGGRVTLDPSSVRNAPALLGAADKVYPK